MKYLAIGFALLAACDAGENHPRLTAQLPPPPHQESGPEVTEKGKVLETAFRLGSSTTTTTQAPGYNKTISKSWVDDPLGMHNKTVEVPTTRSSTTVTVEDQFAVVFECQHGKFLIESLGKESVAHKLWMKLKQGDPVTIRYKEVYRVVPANNTRELVKYEFVDADVAR